MRRHATGETHKQHVVKYQNKQQQKQTILDTDMLDIKDVEWLLVCLKSIKTAVLCFITLSSRDKRGDAGLYIEGCGFTCSALKEKISLGLLKYLYI